MPKTIINSLKVTDPKYCSLSYWVVVYHKILIKRFSVFVAREIKTTAYNFLLNSSGLPTLNKKSFRDQKV